MPIEKSAGAIIFRREPFNAIQAFDSESHQARRSKKTRFFYLLLHYEARHWDLPKGHIEKGEKPEAAAKREIKEETGIKDIEFIPGFKESIKYFYKMKSSNFFKTVVFFLAETKTKKVKISYEHKGFKWLPYEKALKQLTFQNAKDILKKANKFIQLWTK